jgi:N-acetylmuramic acid 6-phosphate etherase
MVDVRTSNAKLRARAERMVMEASALNAEEARQLLHESKGSVKLAIVMHALGLSATDAQQRIDGAGGLIRTMISSPPPPVL